MAAEQAFSAFINSTKIEEDRSFKNPEEVAEQANNNFNNCTKIEGDTHIVQINPKMHSEYKEEITKKNVSLSDIFTNPTKVQLPVKPKISMMLKKDSKQNPKQKNEKEMKQINGSRMQVLRERMQTETDAPVSMVPKVTTGWPLSIVQSLQDMEAPVSMVPKVTTGWPLSIVQSLKDEKITPDTTSSIQTVLTEPSNLGKSKQSAFERLGPPTEAKNPRLTVNLISIEDSARFTRKVIEEHVPVYLRKDVMTSKDPIVKEYLQMWPWAKPVKILRECSHHSVDMLMDEAVMMPHYGSKSSWIKVEARGYPPHFKKEDVLDFIINYVGIYREFIPCFIEFKKEKCTFLVNRSEQALTYLHHGGLVAKKGSVEIQLTVAITNLTLDNLKFYKGTIFKSKLQHSYDEEFKSLNLSAFQLQSDNSHFVYFPLNFTHNQTFLLNVVKATFPWKNITMLDLSGNRLTSVTSLNLWEYFPSLRIFDLSKNLLATVSTLVCFKGIPMYSVSLEGNPLCMNFIQKDHYISVVKLIFPRLLVLDGIKVDSKVEVKKNFSVSRSALKLVNTFLEVFFTLTDSQDRILMESLYTEKSVFSITCRPEMKKNVMYYNLREFYMWCRNLGDSINPSDPLEGSIVGAHKIAGYFNKWPTTMHDPLTFTVDVVLHTETMTVIKVTGLFKIPADTLNQEEPVTEFSRNFVLCTENGIEYKILNDMMYISEATPERVSKSFQLVSINKSLTSVDATSLRFETPPDENLKEKLTEILSKISKLKKSSAIRCLEIVDWNLKKALEYFIRLEKVDAVGTLELI